MADWFMCKFLHTYMAVQNESKWLDQELSGMGYRSWRFSIKPIFYNNLQTRVGSLFSHFEVSFVCSQHISGFSKCRLSITTVHLMCMVSCKITKIALDLTVRTTPPAPYSLSLPLSPVLHVVLSDTTRLTTCSTTGTCSVATIRNYKRKWIWMTIKDHF